MSAKGREMYLEKQTQDGLKRVFAIMSNPTSGKIGFEDLFATLNELGYRVKPTEIEEMIWEVDEDCDKAVSWPEFVEMYDRCRKDKTGYEPKRLFNIVDFMLIDKDNSGHISVEEATQQLYLQYGKARLDEMLQGLFGSEEINVDDTLNLHQYATKMHELQYQQIREKSHRVTKASSNTLKRRTKV